MDAEPANLNVTDASVTQVAHLVNVFIKARRISHGQYQDLYALIMADGNVDEQERRHINRLFDAIQTGSVKIVD